MSEDPFPVVFGICLDAEAIWSGRLEPGAHRPVLLSNGRYAVREGLAPLLDLLERHAIATTFFVPGVTADRYPDAVRAIAARGHELASHTWDHRPAVSKSRDEERDDLLRGIDSIERLCGERPTSWRSASWEFTADTLELLIEAGIEVSASFHDADRPYRHEADDGAPLPIVELPVHWHLADAPYFLYDGSIPGRVLAPASAVFETWAEEFDALHDDRPGSFFHLTLHVQLIGHPGRLRMLERLVEHIAARPRARFMRCDALGATVA